MQVKIKLIMNNRQLKNPASLFKLLIEAMESACVKLL